MSGTLAWRTVAGKRTLVWALVGAALLFVAGANAHLVYVAVTSQPECVAHHKVGEAGDAGGFYGAARSSCSAGADAVKTGE